MALVDGNRFPGRAEGGQTPGGASVSASGSSRGWRGVVASHLWFCVFSGGSSWSPSFVFFRSRKGFVSEVGVVGTPVECPVGVCRWGERCRRKTVEASRQAPAVQSRPVGSAEATRGAEQRRGGLRRRDTGGKPWRQFSSRLSSVLLATASATLALPRGRIWTCGRSREASVARLPSRMFWALSSLGVS